MTIQGEMALNVTIGANLHGARRERVKWKRANRGVTVLETFKLGLIKRQTMNRLKKH